MIPTTFGNDYMDDDGYINNANPKVHNNTSLGRVGRLLYNQSYKKYMSNKSVQNARKVVDTMQSECSYQTNINLARN